MGSELTPDVVRYAYSLGYFPMAESDDGPIHWYYPHDRCLLPIEGMHVSRSLRRRLRKFEFEISFDCEFEAVMRGCRRESDNWINEELIQLYCAIHREGWAHSCEVWFDSELVGGVYGLALGGCFSAESMFSRRTDASKVGLYHLIHHVRELGFTMFDAQFINDHTASLGAYEVPQQEYLKDLEIALKQVVPWSPEQIFVQAP